MKYYRLAAEQGDAQAQFDLGLCYYNGQGVPHDNAEAIKYFRMAAEQGDPNARKWVAMVLKRSPELSAIPAENKVSLFDFSEDDDFGLQNLFSEETTETKPSIPASVEQKQTEENDY